MEQVWIWKLKVKATHKNLFHIFIFINFTGSAIIFLILKKNVEIFHYVFHISHK